MTSNNQSPFEWPKFMRRQAMVWERMPTSWRDAPFLGNGMLGAMLHQDGSGLLCLELGRSDIAECRPDGDVYDGQHRLRIGRFRLRTRGDVHSCRMRLDLWNARLVGRIETDAGVIGLRAYVHSLDMTISLDLRLGGDEAVEWQWQPEYAVSPHVVHRNKPVMPERMNPPPVMYRRRDGVEVCRQSLLAGGEYVTAWRSLSSGPRRRSYMISIANDRSDTSVGPAEQTAVKNIASESSARDRMRRHIAWWRDYYQASAVSISDARLENFYWIQMYKLGSATRADRQVLDLMGPWPAVTVWPGIWWNLNIQLCYYPVYAANRLNLGESLCRFLDRNLPNFVANVDPAWQHDSAGIDVQTGYGCRQNVEREFCNLAWTCHNYWLQYRYSMDESLLDRLYPLLSRSINLYWHLLREEADGKLHLPRSRSPEYGKWAEDTNINLALIRWGCQTLLWICRHQKRDEPLTVRWQEMLDRVVDYPVDPKTGLMIGRDVPLAESHRHYSHLLMIYPLYLMTWDEPEHRELIERSLRHWIGLPGALQGYTFSGAASIFASIKNGNEARDMLNQCLDRYIQPNTMYCEWDSPVMETPLSIATSVQEMLLQSWGSVIRVLPAIPDDWKDVSFSDLRAEGAFLISAARKDGLTRFVRVTSLAGEPCTVEVAFESDVIVDGPADCLLERPSRSRFRLRLAAGETAVIHRVDETGPFRMRDVHGNRRPDQPFFGLVGDRASFAR